jgi:hypothetical protein
LAQPGDRGRRVQNRLAARIVRINDLQSDENCFRDGDLDILIAAGAATGPTFDLDCLLLDCCEDFLGPRDRQNLQNANKHPERCTPVLGDLPTRVTQPFATGDAGVLDDLTQQIISERKRHQQGYADADIVHLVNSNQAHAFPFLALKLRREI